MKNPTLVDSFKKAFEGVVLALRKERHIQLAVVIAVAVLIAGLLLKLSLTSYMALAFATTFVLVAELLNTALEHAIDLVTREYHPMARVAKDLAAAAVLVAVVNAVVVAILILIDKFGT